MAASASNSWWKRQAGPLPIWAWLVGAFLVIGLIAALSDSTPDETATPAKSTSEGASSVATEPTDQTMTTERISTTSATPTTAPPTTAVPATTAAPVTAPAAPPPAAVMPNVVCMNLQVAQDLIQTTGVFYSRSHDATGAGRMQVLDSNWIVVNQTPAAGTPISEGDADLGAVKIGEPSGC